MSAIESWSVVLATLTTIVGELNRGIANNTTDVSALWSNKKIARIGAAVSLLDLDESVSRSAVSAIGSQLTQ